MQTLSIGDAIWREVQEETVEAAGLDPAEMILTRSEQPVISYFDILDRDSACLIFSHLSAAEVAKLRDIGTPYVACLVKYYLERYMGFEESDMWLRDDLRWATLPPDDETDSDNDDTRGNELVDKFFTAAAANVRGRWSSENADTFDKYYVKPVIGGSSGLDQYLERAMLDNNPTCRASTEPPPRHTYEKDYLQPSVNAHDRWRYGEGTIRDKKVDEILAKWWRPDRAVPILPTTIISSTGTETSASLSYEEMIEAQYEMGDEYAMRSYQTATIMDRSWLEVVSSVNSVPPPPPPVGVIIGPFNLHRGQHPSLTAAVTGNPAPLNQDLTATIATMDDST